MRRAPNFALLLGVVALALSGVVTAQVPSVGETNGAAKIPIVNNEYAVLDAVILKYYPDTKRPIIIDDSFAPCTVSSNHLRDTEELFEPLRLAKTHNDCFLKPEQSVDIKQFQSRHRFVTIKNSDYRKFFQSTDCEEGWKKFYKRHPGAQGYAKFSRVGIDENKEFAILEFSYVKGCLDGEGHILIMRHIDGKWQVASDSIIWVF